MPITTALQPLWIQDGDAEGDGTRWLRFERPEHVISCHDVNQVDHCLRQVQQQVDAGYTAAGFVSYEAAAAFDPSMQVVAGGELPLVWFALYEASSITVMSGLPGSQTMSGRDSSSLPDLDWRSSVTSTEYHAAIQRIKDAIAAGDSYQVNYTYRLSAKAQIDPWQLFLHLQHAQQGRYAAYLDLGDQVICSASPELFFAVDGDTIVTRPMKGTAARGSNEDDDQRQRRKLLASDKDRAENLMIVDMLRNDLSRIARLGSVEVEQLWRLEAYPTLWQMTTPIRAKLQPDIGLPELFRALFPCASITGAPKIKTMELISRLEGQPRQIYTGAIGFVTPDGRSQFNVAIRTALFQRRDHHHHHQSRIEYGVGGGIVWDSQADAEWCETRTKARVLPGLAPFRLLETLLWQPVRGYSLLDEHLQRLQASADHFGYPMDCYAIRQQLISAAAGRRPQRWRVRCLLAASGAVELQFIAQPYQPQRRAVRLRLARTAVQHDDPLLGHKTDQRQRYQRLLDEVDDADDVLMVNERGEVTETTIANIVAYIDGRWLTPSLRCGLLPGTLRRVLLDSGQIHERVIKLTDLTAQTPLYVINSVRGWRWAHLVDCDED
ncbi:MAG: aminodeoxychorismate synthase component I [Desulfuromonas sp.]|nr:aminodeoxychorismate synthase component I [Desulfuromonas sp.]